MNARDRLWSSRLKENFCEALRMMADGVGGGASSRNVSSLLHSPALHLFSGRLTLSSLGTWINLLPSRLECSREDSIACPSSAL